ncbi:MAG TPA: family 1 encapsulin nanocompartment shell protein [Pseudonocardia sp.]|jgi:uncharacterized linocin/CFP29 family protein
MDHLLRDIAPIPSVAWQRIDEEARERLVPLLAARRVVDWSGGGGWERSAVSLGRTADVPTPPGSNGGVQTRQRRVLTLTEIRVPFTVDRREIADAQRGARDLEFDDLFRAARQAAETENRAVFHGWPDAGIVGIMQASPAPNIKLGEDMDSYPGVVTAAVERLRLAGVEGPYALCVGPDIHGRILQASEDGHLLLDHIGRILGGSVIWTPGLDGAVVLSQRGGDFTLSVGQDLSIGYLDHDADTVNLYLEESFTFQTEEPDAAIALTT